MNLFLRTFSAFSIGLMDERKKLSWLRDRKYNQLLKALGKGFRERYNHSTNKDAVRGISVSRVKGE